MARLRGIGMSASFLHRFRPRRIAPEMTRGPNPLKGWQLDPASIRHVGHDLSRPECILAERDGSLWTADARGGAMHIRPDGSQELIAPSSANAGTPNLIEGTLPNGLAFAR